MDISLLDSNDLKELNQKLDSILQKLNEKQPPQSEWLTVEEVMKALHISKRTVFSYLSQGILGGSHLSGKRKLFFKKTDVEKLLTDHYLKSFKN